MSRFIDLNGKKFCRLSVIKHAGQDKYKANIWECLCDCGKTVYATQAELTSGHTKSCGCYSREMAKERMTTHGLRHTQLYKVWAGIKDRTNQNNHNCKNNYKKLNITMCKEWHDDFMSFYNWAIENGYKEEKLPNGRNKWTIDRIDGTKGYCPENCRWITDKEQMNNQLTNKKITYQGKTQNLSQWCEELGLNYGLVNQRLWNGFSVERAFTESADKQKYYEYKGELLNINQISERTGLTRTNVCNRIFRGWDMERLMTQPARKITKGVNKNV